MLVLIKGAGDLATGTAVRLYRAGIKVVMTEVAQPTAVRRTVAFSQCMYDGAAQVEGISARRAEDAGAARRALERGEVPVLCDPEAAILRELPFDGVVDAILAKRNLGTAITDAPVVLALGPGFTAGVDCHGVVETMRGHDLGRLLTRGSAVPNTGVPGDVGGYTTQRIIRAPADGVFEPLAAIGQRVEEGQPVARVAGRTARAQLTGVVRGMLPAGLAGTHPQQPDSSMTRASNGMSFFMELGPPSVFILCLIYSIRWGLILQLQMCYKKQQKRAENAACRRGRRHFSVFILFTPWKRRIPPVWRSALCTWRPSPARHSPPPREHGRQTSRWRASAPQCAGRFPPSPSP